MNHTYPPVAYDERTLLEDILTEIDGVHIVSVTSDKIIISDGHEKYEYDSLAEAIIEWNGYLASTQLIV